MGWTGRCFVCNSESYSHDKGRCAMCGATHAEMHKAVQENEIIEMGIIIFISIIGLAGIIIAIISGGK